MGAFELVKLIEERSSEEESLVVTMVESDGEVIGHLESLGLNGTVCALHDLSAELRQLRKRQSDTSNANGIGLARKEIDEMNKLVELDWMNQKVDRLRVRYGVDAELVIVADSWYWRSEAKEETLRNRYEKDQQVVVQAAAEGEKINGRSLSKSSQRKRRSILCQSHHEKRNEGAQLEFGIASEHAYVDYERSKPPIKIPLPEDLHHDNPIIRKLVVTLLSKATFVQANREADQALIAYIRKGGGPSASYEVTSRPEDYQDSPSTSSHHQQPSALSNSSSSSPNLPSPSSLSRPHPIGTIFIIDGKDGDYVVDFPCDIPNGFFVSDIKRDSNRSIRIIDMDELDQAEWFPLETNEGKSFAQDMVKSDLSAGTKNLGWKGLFKNAQLVKLLSEAPNWSTLVEQVRNCPQESRVQITFPDGGTSSVKSIEELDKLFDRRFMECFKTPLAYSWTLSDLVRWHHVRHDDKDPTRAINKKEMTVSSVTTKLQEGITRVVNETRNHVSTTSPPLFSMPVDSRTASRFDNSEIRSNPRTIYPLDSPFHSFVDGGHRNPIQLSSSSTRQHVGLAGPLGRRETAPSIRSRVSNNGGAINRAESLVKLTNTAFDETYGDQADEEAKRQVREKMENLEEFKKKGVMIFHSRPKPKKLTKSGKESKAGTNSHKGGRGFKMSQVFSTRVRSGYLESSVRNLGFTANLVNPVKDGEFKKSLISVIQVLQDVAITQLDQLFTLLQSILLDLSYWHGSTITDLEFDKRGLVDMAKAIATLSYSIDRTNDAEVASQQEINTIVGGYRSYIGKHGSDLLRRSLGELRVTNEECRVFQNTRSEWINPISFLHVLREKRRQDHARFDLNWTGLIVHNLTSLHTNFLLSSARHGSTIVKDLSEKTVGGLLEMLDREGDFGPNLNHATPLYSSDLKERANQAGVRETLKRVEGNRAKSGKGLAMVRLGERYINDSCIIVNEEEDETDDDRLRDGVIGLFSSIQPQILLVIPPPLDENFDPSTDTEPLIDVTSRVILECFQVLRFVLRKRIEGERIAARRAVKWKRRGLNRRGKPEELLETLEGLETLGDFFKGGEIEKKWMKENKMKDGRKGSTFEDAQSSDWTDESEEEEEEGEERSRRDSEDSDSDEESIRTSQQRRRKVELDEEDFQAKKGEWAESVRRVGQQFKQVLQKPQIARRFEAIAFDLCDLARSVRSPNRMSKKAVNLYLPELVKKQVETIVEEVQSINRSHSTLLRQNSSSAPASTTKLSKRIKEIALRTDSKRSENNNNTSQDSWFIDHPFLEIDETGNGPVPLVKINHDKLQEFERSCDIVSRVIEGCVLGNEEMTWSGLLAMLEEMGGEITRAIFRIPLGRCLPTGRMLVDGTGLVRLDVMDPLKLVKKGKGSVGGEALLAQLGVSPELGWKAILPIVLVRHQTKLAAAYDYLTFEHIYERIQSCQQPPRNEKLLSYVQKFDSTCDGHHRQLSPLFERNDNGQFVVGGEATISPAIRLDWTRDSGVIGRQNGSPRVDYGIEYEDFEPVDANSSADAKRRREDLEWINDADCQIGMDLGQKNLISITVSRQGETSDVCAMERSGSSEKAVRELQHLELADRRFGQKTVIGKLFEVDENPIDNVERFFSNENRLLPPSSSSSQNAYTVSPRSPSSLPPNITTRVRLLETSGRRKRLRRHESRRSKRLQRDWARLLKKVTKGAESIGVAIGEYGKGASGGVAAGSATESLKAFLNALGSLQIESKVIFVNEAWTSTYCYRCLSTLNFPTRQAVNGVQTPILRILECIDCRRIENRDTIGSTNATVVAHSIDLKVPSNILDSSNTRIRDGYIRETKREVNRASGIRDEAIRGAESRDEMTRLTIGERSRRKGNPVTREKGKKAKRRM